MAGHTALGALLALGTANAWSAAPVGGILLGLLLWVICLNGGTLAINSAWDHDEGDIAYLRRPPPPPAGLFRFGLGLMLLGQALALLLPAPFALLYAICFVLSVLYSVPPWRLKATPGADWFINMWGFGTLTPWAGWASTGVSLDVTHALVLIAFCPLFAALYPLTQLYQVEEDRRRGDRTFALWLGERRSLMVATAAALIAFVLLAVAAVWSGWPVATWRWAVIAVALGCWMMVLVPWLRSAETRSPAAHQRGMYQALAAWAVTDAAVLVAWALRW
ncbi:MAG TPA: UbiA family prenyltransferase [Gemmatimonadales bacterium]|nr:UbiA family prenyltransferase [Gemmatimonadales bacterium]